LVVGEVRRDTCRAENGHRLGQVGEGAEALDELGLDAQNPPGVLVLPPGGTPAVEQPLVVSGFRHEGAADQRRALAAFGSLAIHRVSWNVEAPGGENPRTIRILNYRGTESAGASSKWRGCCSGPKAIFPANDQRGRSLSSF